MLFDALTGNLPEAQTYENASLEDCTSLYTVENIEILLTAGYKIRHCANLDSKDIRRYLESNDFLYTKAIFEGELFSCLLLDSRQQTRECYAETVCI